MKEYTTESEAGRYSFYTNKEETGLLAIANQPRKESGIEDGYVYLECVVGSPGSKGVGDELIEYTVNLGKGKVGLASASESLISLYQKKYGFKLVGQFEEDWSSIGQEQSRP